MPERVDSRIGSGEQEVEGIGEQEDPVVSKSLRATQKSLTATRKRQDKIWI